MNLKREVPANVLKHLPRKRLPPINSINRSNDIKFGKTMSNFNKKPKNILIDAEEGKNTKLDINNDNNNALSNFYKNNIIS